MREYVEVLCYKGEKILDYFVHIPNIEYQKLLILL